MDKEALGALPIENARPKKSPDRASKVSAEKKMNNSTNLCCQRIIYKYRKG